MLSAALLTMAVAAADPTYSEDIAPLIRQHCVECHRDGGGAPFALTTFEEVRRRGRQLVEVTRRRYMPPWMPDPGGSVTFENERRLTADEIDLIDRWVASGFAEGDRRDSREPIGNFGDWQLYLPRSNYFE